MKLVYTVGVRSSLLVGLMGLLLVTSCESVPETGRSRAPLLTSESYENSLGAEAYAEATGEFPEITGTPDAEMVQRIGDRIAAASGRSEYEWEFKLLDAPDSINAFALPGGKVAVYSGILNVTQNEDALAAVMGHEVAHATLRHGGERMSNQLYAGLILAGVSVGLEFSDMDSDDQGYVMAAFGAGAQYGYLLPYSRLHESEADEVGLRYLVRAGYNPNEAPGLWERMAERNPDRPPEFLSTHPDPLARAQRLREMIPRVIAEERSR